MGQKNRPRVPLNGGDGEVDGVGIAFTVMTGLALGVVLYQPDGQQTFCHATIISLPRACQQLRS